MTAWLGSDPVISFFLAILLALLTYLLRARVKIRWTVTHGFVHNLKGSEIDARRVPPPGETEPPPPARDMNFWALTLRVFNTGRSVARDVEITMNWRPLGLSVHPQRHYFEQLNPDRRYLLIFPTLGPREIITVHMLDARELPEILNVRSAEGFGKIVPTQPQIIFPTWMNVLAVAFMAVGLIVSTWSIVYLAIQLLRWMNVIDAALPDMAR